MEKNAEQVGISCLMLDVCFVWVQFVTLICIHGMGHSILIGHMGCIVLI